MSYTIHLNILLLSYGQMVQVCSSLGFQFIDSEDAAPWRDIFHNWIQYALNELEWLF